MIHPAHKRVDRETPRVEQWAQRLAAGIGTVQFLAAQTAFIAAWVGLNITGLVQHWDPYPFILLNLAFSTQAAYAAPLILLAARSQEARDRARADHDHEASEENLQLTRAIHAQLAGGTH
jgi:uncharacterized membrane protein